MSYMTSMTSYFPYMINAKNNETVFKFVKVMSRILVASFYRTRCIRINVKHLHQKWVLRATLFNSLIKIYKDRPC